MKQGTPARKGSMSVGGGWTRMRPTENDNQHGEPRRSLEGLDCLGMLAGNASEHAISVRQTQASVARESALRRHRLPPKKRAPRGGS